MNRPLRSLLSATSLNEDTRIPGRSTGRCLATCRRLKKCGPRLLACVYLASLAGCAEHAPPERESSRSHRPPAAEQAAGAVPAQIYELATGTVYYGGDPQYGHKPDGTLRRGTKVSLVRRAGNYSVVRIEDGSEAYVATHLLEPLAMQ